MHVPAKSAVQGTACRRHPAKLHAQHLYRAAVEVRLRSRTHVAYHRIHKKGIARCGKYQFFQVRICQCIGATRHHVTRRRIDKCRCGVTPAGSKIFVLVPGLSLRQAIHAHPEAKANRCKCFSCCFYFVGKIMGGKGKFLFLVADLPNRDFTQIVYPFRHLVWRPFISAWFFPFVCLNNTNMGVEDPKTSATSEAIQKMKELAEKIRVCLFCTQSTELPFETRPVGTPTGRRGRQTSRFFSSAGSHKEPWVISRTNRYNGCMLTVATPSFWPILAPPVGARPPKRWTNCGTKRGRRLTFPEGIDDLTMTLVSVKPQYVCLLGTPNTAKWFPCCSIAAAAITGTPQRHGRGKAKWLRGTITGIMDDACNALFVESFSPICATWFPHPAIKTAKTIFFSGICTGICDTFTKNTHDTEP